MGHYAGMRRDFDMRLVAASLIVAFLVSACGSSSANSSAGRSEPTSFSSAARPAVGPFVPDPNNPTEADTHWHAALGVYNCDHWMGDRTGKGIWVWPHATHYGSPARADNTNVYAGMHSHDDGIIHMEPAEAVDTGMNTTVGRYFGRFATQVTIPAGAAAGQHKLIAVGSQGSTAVITMTVS